jgi:quercetin dioxygenase-like cupin family protein
MRKKITLVLLLAVGIMVLVLGHAGNLRATVANQFTSVTLFKGTFADIDVFNHFIPPGVSEREARRKKEIWLSWQKTKGASDLYIQQNTWAPGGDTGWHTHPGHSLIIVTAGTVTAYEGDDADCKPTVYTAGTTLVDAGGDHVHILRNEGTVPAQTVAVQLIPAGQPRRIDVVDPGNCHF